jgi:hypothetical protein
LLEIRSVAGKITDYIRANRDRYTREAIRAQLIAAGHDSAAIDAAWDEVGRSAKPDAPAPGGTGRFVAGLALVLYALGFLGVLPLAGAAPYRTTGPLALLVGLVIYAVAGYLALRAVRWAAAHLHPGFLGALVALLALPIAFTAVVVGSWVGGLRLTR